MSNSKHCGRAGRRGSAAIEAGLTIVLLFGFIFLIADLALAVFLKSTLQQAVREGVRYGITGRLHGTAEYLNDSIIQVVQDHSLGFLRGVPGACSVQINYYNPDTGEVSSGTGGDLLVVSVNGFRYPVLGPIFKVSPISISVSSSDIIERCSPTEGCPPVQNPVPLECP